MKNINLFNPFLLLLYWTFLLPVHVSGTIIATDIIIKEPVLIDSTFNLYKTGTIYLSGQPTQDDFEKLNHIGISMVINIRSDPEMEKHNQTLFNEEKHIKSLGMSYINAEVGGNAGYQPEVISRIAAAIKSADGKILIHCRSAARATLVWMAWLVRYQDYNIDEAVRMGKMIRFSFPLEELLGFPITIKKEE